MKIKIGRLVELTIELRWLPSEVQDQSGDQSAQVYTHELARDIPYWGLTEGMPLRIIEQYPRGSGIEFACCYEQFGQIKAITLKDNEIRPISAPTTHTKD